jgi:hypothetical protein
MLASDAGCCGAVALQVQRVQDSHRKAMEERRSELDLRLASKPAANGANVVRASGDVEMADDDGPATRASRASSSSPEPEIAVAPRQQPARAAASSSSSSSVNPKTRHAKPQANPEPRALNPEPTAQASSSSSSCSSLLPPPRRLAHPYCRKHELACSLSARSLCSLSLLALSVRVCLSVCPPASLPQGSTHTHTHTCLCPPASRCLSLAHLCVVCLRLSWVLEVCFGKLTNNHLWLASLYRTTTSGSTNSDASIGLFHKPRFMSRPPCGPLSGAVCSLIPKLARSHPATCCIAAHL